MKRITLIVGAPASGKSTAGKFTVTYLQERGIEVIHINEVSFIETVVRLYDPRLDHVYEAEDGTLVFKDQYTLEKMNEFIFSYAVNLHPYGNYVIEIGRGIKQESISSNYMKTFKAISEDLYKDIQVLHIVSNESSRLVREDKRKSNGDQYCPNIQEYAQNDLEEVKQTYSMIDFITIHNNGDIEEYQKQLANILNSHDGN